MACFLLVHGAWHGGWAWDLVADILRDRGHEVHAPTLTGLAERAHLLSGDITADTHVADITGLIGFHDLRDVVLVGHSYGGMVVTGVAGQMPERLSALIYLDAFVPQVSGVSLFANANPDRMAKFQAEIDAGAVGLAPDNFHNWTDDPETEAMLRAKCTPHPVGCFQQGVTLTGREAEVARRAYILCTRHTRSAFWPEYEKLAGRAGWQRDTMPTLHNAMCEDPEGLADRLERLAGLMG